MKEPNTPLLGTSLTRRPRRAPFAMQQMKMKWIIAGCVVLAALYVVGPIIAGATGTGEREGPCFYPAELHTALYIIGYEVEFGVKPRESPEYWMYRRPLFYGMSRRLKSSTEREAYIEKAKRNESPRLARLIKMNQEANQAAQATAPKVADPGR